MSTQHDVIIGTGVDLDGELEHGRDRVTVGSLLRAERERRGLSVEACAAEIRSRREQLVALEQDRFEVFGGDIYARGFIRAYARLLGLDEATLLGLHGSDPAFAPTTLRQAPEPVSMRRGVPPALVATLGVLALGGAVVGVLLLGGSRTPPVAAPIDLPVTAEPSPPPTASPGPTPTPPPVPVPAAPPVVLVLTVEAASWLEVVVDGLALELRRTATAGETLRFTAQTQVAVRFGNAGGVRAELNGVDLGLQGRAGQVVDLVYGPDGVVD